MEGRVEVCRDSYSRWGTVCNKQWTVTHSKVVCRNLGFSDSEGIMHALMIIITLQIQLVFFMVHRFLSGIKYLWWRSYSYCDGLCQLFWVRGHTVGLSSLHSQLWMQSQ